MRIINEKGKLFGLINIIDLGVILLLVGMVPMIYFGYKVILAGYTSKLEEVTVKIRFEDIEMHLVNTMKEGDVQRESSGREIGKLVSIDNINPSDGIMILNKSVVVKVDPSKRKDVFITVDLLCEKEAESLYYNDNPLKIGADIVFSPYLYTATGDVLDIKIKGEEDKKL